jgi:hypothetical protein
MTARGLVPNPKRVNEIGIIYGRAERMLQKEFLSITPLNFTEIRAFETKKDVRKIVEELNKSSVRWSKESVPETYRETSKIAKTQLDILGFKKNVFFDEQVHERTVKDETRETVGDYVSANLSINQTLDIYLYLMRQASNKIASIQAWDMRDEEVISNLLDDAIEMGATQWQLQKLIQGHFDEVVGGAQFININGRNYNLKKYSKMVARTRLRTVQSKATINQCKYHDEDLVEVSNHGTKTPICLPFEGNTYSITGKTKLFPQLPEEPPFHPNCWHFIFPTSEEAIAWRVEQEAPFEPGEV